MQVLYSDTTASREIKAKRAKALKKIGGIFKVSLLLGSCQGKGKWISPLACLLLKFSQRAKKLKMFWLCRRVHSHPCLSALCERCVRSFATIRRCQRTAGALNADLEEWQGRC